MHYILSTRYRAISKQGITHYDHTWLAYLNNEVKFRIGSAGIADFVLDCSVVFPVWGITVHKR